MLRRLVAIAAFIFLCAPSLSLAAECEQHFVSGAAPVLVKDQLGRDATEICYSGYAVLYSGVSRTPLWSAEHLTADRIEAAQRMKRDNAFHADPNLPDEVRSELSDYARTGFDRGHMSPSGDMPDQQSQYESFSLANMSPQDPDNNRGLWEGIESATRSLALHDGEVFVVTGPLFEGRTVLSLHNRVMVPTGFFKAIYDPFSGETSAYVVKNVAGMDWQTVSIVELRRRIGIDVFPALPEEVKRQRVDLPPPTPHYSSHIRKVKPAPMQELLGDLLRQHEN